MNVIFHTSNSTKRNKTREKNKIKQKLKHELIEVCIKCLENKEGWCSKYKGWCRLVNYNCKGETRPRVVTEKIVHNEYKKSKRKNVRKKY